MRVAEGLLVSGSDIEGIVGMETGNKDRLMSRTDSSSEGR